MLNKFSKAANVFDTAAVPPPVPISSLEDLQKIGRDADYSLSGAYQLTNDIDASPSRGGGWVPIGRWFVGSAIEWDGAGYGSGSFRMEDIYDGAFTGVFDGNGYAIRGLCINNPIPAVIDTARPFISAGFFGSLDGATVLNLTVEADTVAVNGCVNIAAGVLAGFSRNSVIKNCRVSGTVGGRNSGGVSPNSYLGGFVGWATEDSISDSSSEVTLAGLNAPGAAQLSGSVAGGLVGMSMRTAISGCSAAVGISALGLHANVGGLAGENHGGVITESSAALTGELSSDSINSATVGGLAGVNAVDYVHDPDHPECGKHLALRGTIAHSRATVNMNWCGETSVRVGGLVGYEQGGIITDCYADGTIISGDGVAPGENVVIGELIGDRFYSGPLGTIERCYAAIEGGVDIEEPRLAQRQLLVG